MAIRAILLPVLFAVTVCVSVHGVLALLAWAARRGQPRADERRGGLLFRHAALLRGYAVMMGAGTPLAITVLAFVSPPRGQGEVYAAVGSFALFIVLNWPLMWEAFRFGVLVTPEGLHCRSPWRGTRFLPWEAIRALSSSADRGSGFLIEAWDGYRFRVPLLTAGLCRFLACCEEHLSPDQLRSARPGYDRVGRPFPVDLTKWGERRTGGGEVNVRGADDRTRRQEDRTQGGPGGY